jgi:hypothetical protein
MADCPSRFTLASLRAGDLPPDEIRRVEAHVGSCDACRAVIGEIDANVAEYEARADDHLARLLTRIEDEPEEAEVVPLAPRRRSRVVVVAAAVGALAAAAMLALVLIPVLGDRDDEDQGDIRFKGSLAVEIVAQRDGEQFKVTDGTELRADDAIRFVVTTGEPGWITVFSIDRTGRLSPFYPDADPASSPDPLRIDSAGRNELPGSIILDDSRGHEEIVVVFCRERFDRSRVHRAVAGAGDPTAAVDALGPGFALRVFRVIKGPP